MLQPRRVKFRKTHRGRRHGKANSGNAITFGEYGLQAMEPGWLTARQIEAGRRAITRYVRRGANIWVRVFPDKSVSKKAAETRMGSGKGAPDHWVAVVKPGHILYEMAGISEEVAKEAMRLASNKLPLPAKFLVKETLVAAGSETG